MPVHELEEHVARERYARQSEEIGTAEASGTTSQTTKGQPSKVGHRKAGSWSLSHLRWPLRIVFADNEQATPSDPEPTPTPAGPRRLKKIHVAIDRKSMASSFWQKQPEHIPTLLNPKPWLRFRNAEEAKEFICVLPTLRDSYFADPDDREVERCGRECQVCKGKYAHSRQEQQNNTPPEVVIVVTDETEQEASDSQSSTNVVPRDEVHSFLSDLFMYADEMESRL
ncbi:hypothetical protein FRC17_000952 [Serendipita sp. 399]|nr:hypothetical protein FRC17_000952 [Serendipita sp. 399]